MNKISILALLLFTFTTLAHAKESPWAKVTLVHGNATLVSGTETSHALKLGEKLSEGSVIKTEEKSLAQIRMADKSILNIAPSSQIELTAGKDSEPALWNLVAGSIRALIKKSEDHSQEKLIIRAGSAAIGIRGTDFSVSFDAATNKTTLVTIQGSVAMANVSAGMSPVEALRSNGAVLVNSGQSSQLLSGAVKPSTPQALPASQLQRLQKNSTSTPNPSQISNSNGAKPGPTDPTQQPQAPRGGNNSMMGPPGSAAPGGNPGGQSPLPSPTNAPPPQSLGSSTLPSGPNSGGGALPPPPSMNAGNAPPPAVSPGSTPNQSVGGSTVGGGLPITPNKPGGLPNGKPPGK